MAFYYSRLGTTKGSGPPFTLVGAGSWTERAPATLGGAHYTAMMANLATLSGEIQGDFNSANRDQYAARRGITVAQGPDYDAIDGGETGDGFGYTATLTTSSTKYLPQNTNNMTWYPKAYRPWGGYGTVEAGTNRGGDWTAPQAYGTPPGGSDLNSIIFSKTSWDAARTDLEEWIADITNFWTGFDSDPKTKAIEYSTLESYDEGEAIMWQTDNPWISPERDTNDPATSWTDDTDYSYSTPQLNVFVNSGYLNLGTTENDDEYYLQLFYWTTGQGSNIVSTSASRTIDIGTFNSSGVNIDSGTGASARQIAKGSLTDLTSGTPGEYVVLCFQRKGDNAQRGSVLVREAYAA